MAGTEKTIAMVNAVQAHYKRLLDLGADKRLPATMADFKQRIDYMMTAISLPEDPNSIGADAGVLAGYQTLRPEMEKAEARVRKAIDDETALLTTSGNGSGVAATAQSASSGNRPAWLMPVLIGGAVLLGYFMLKGSGVVGSNPKKRG